MPIKSMQLSWITVNDLHKARSFFADTLGLILKTDAPDMGWMELQGKEGGMILGIGAAQPGVKSFENAVVTLTTDDIEQTKKNLEDKGVQFLGDIIEVPGHVRLAMFVDFENHMFQLVQSIGAVKK
jgi:predicted enzyme related to lactoylglutathione lyase